MVPIDKETWADRDYRLAQVSKTTVIHKGVVEVNLQCLDLTSF